MNKISLDVLFSTLFAILAVLFNFWLIKEAELYLPTALLGVFMLIRRLAPTFSNLNQLGCSQALTRFMSLNRDDEGKIRNYYFISLAIWLISNVIMLFLYITLKEPIGRLLLPKVYGRDTYLALTFVYISILHLSYVVQPYFLNIRNILMYNVSNMMNASLIMLAVFMVLGNSENLIEVLGTSLLVMGALQLIFLGYIVIKLKLYNLSSKGTLRTERNSFLTYGLPRAGMTFFEMFMLTVGSLLVKEEQEVVGSFLIAITLARVVLIVLQPISRLSSVIVGHDNETDKPRRTLNLLFGGVIYSSTLVIIVLFNWIDILIRFWLTKENMIVDVISVFKILVFGLLPYCIFQGLKGYIEIRYFKPVNLFTIVMATLVHVFLFYVCQQFYTTLSALAISLMVAFISMGLSSYYWCRKDINGQGYFKFIYFFTVTFLLFMINHFLNLYLTNLLGFAIALMITMFGFFAFILYGKIPFVKDVLATFGVNFLKRFIK
ncbi:hypothetical protein V1387_02885 [Allomuricauda taeanensis]|uniref:hypothetical protein n=1 Tax=Flagellimonas taeanensis TaxID=1005926 RepID=UPI002E7B22A0|nr:hypothetical protein [Allomuricauda taeanensis]MEE1961615.1 hypothetical protein [Allomuricauda taeanensis]